MARPLGALGRKALLAPDTKAASRMARILFIGIDFYDAPVFLEDTSPAFLERLYDRLMSPLRLITDEGRRKNEQQPAHGCP